MKNTTFIRTIAAAVIGLASASAFAAGPVVTDANYPGPMSLQSNTTRAQVRAELMQAKAAGQVFDGEQYPGPMARSSNVPYSQVRAELDQFKAQGLAFNDATYPVPGHTVANKQAQRELASFGIAGQATLVR